LGEPGFEVVRKHKGKVQSDGPNLYQFVDNNPISRTDSIGLQAYHPLGWPMPRNNPWDRLVQACPISRCAKAINEARSMLGNVSNDARAHCIASCKIAKGCGQGIASGLGTLKEARDLSAGGIEWTVFWVIPKSWEEWLHDNLQGGNTDDSADDFYANDYGLDLAKNGKNCMSECEKKFGTEP